MRLVLFLLFALPAGAQTWDAMRDITPRGYVAHRAPTPVVIDGKLDEPAWLAAPWTDPFVDIEGDAKPLPRYLTRARMLWDDAFLYVGAQMEEPHVWGDSTRRNSVIFYDNDLEIFLDPDGDNHGYYEFEVNALNTIWELTLEKPYKDGGPAISPTNLPGLRSAVFVDGTLNAAHDTDRGWSVEVALPLAELAAYNGGRRPMDGDQWRIGLSRVEWQHRITEGGDYEKVPDTPENNWVWSPQGIVDMHRPERWGFVQFTTAPPGTVAFRPDPTLAARDLLMEVYHAQKAHHETHERWATSLDDLGLPADRLASGAARVVGMRPEGDGFVVTAEVRQPDGTVRTLWTNHLSRIWEDAP
ncbi:carbohydrate-binding family 9-like protein [Rubrivirga sp.]|uniref:carbohydrate-binding family 9-like protein n=1 Tax=Rubrivirga sp. TaxID=1885344 RepID=UPI003B52D888